MKKNRLMQLLLHDQTRLSVLSNEGLAFDHVRYIYNPIHVLTADVTLHAREGVLHVRYVQT